jgi:transposase
MTKTAKISKEKQQPIIITLRHECQSMRRISRTLKVSSSAIAKTIKRFDVTGSHEDRHKKGRPRVTSAAEEKFIRVTSIRNCSPNNCFTELK